MMDTKNLSSILLSLAECPICCAFAPDRKVFLCQNSHPICEKCLEARRGTGSKCPQGSCAYAEPPMRDRATERLIREVDFDFPCSADPNHCDFEGKRGEMPGHLKECCWRKVECPACWEKFKESQCS